jgi:hypothetical protein
VKQDNVFFMIVFLLSSVLFLLVMSVWLVNGPSAFERQPLPARAIQQTQQEEPAGVLPSWAVPRGFGVPIGGGLTAF